MNKPVEHMATGRPEAGSYYANLYNAAQSELASLREELARLKEITNFKDAVACVFDMLKYAACNTSNKQWDDQLEDLAEDVIEFAPEYKKQWKDIGVLSASLVAAEQRNAELQKQLDSIDKHLRGNVNDPDPFPPIMPGAFSYTTTYGLVAGLRRERDYLKKSATPLPAGDDYLRQIAQRLREYVGNPHHINPLSEAFKRLIDDSAFALSKLAALKPTESGASE